MSITIRPYRRGGWEVDIRVVAPDGVREVRERKRAPTSARSAAVRWAESRERVLFERLMKPPQDNAPPKEVPSLRAFASRFLDGHARADRQKGSGIAAKEVILRVHLVPALGHKKIDAITSEDVQHLKGRLSTKAAKTVNNILTVLNVLLKKAVEWNVIDRVPCTIRLLRVSKSSTFFYDFEEFERLIVAARATDARAYLLVLMAGEAGLRLGEMAALEWSDIDFVKRQVCVQRSAWKGQIASPKGGRLRYVPLTLRLAAALREHRHLRGPLVLYQDDGSLLTEGVVQGFVRRAAQKAGLFNNGPHMLRHTFCSHLAMRGAPARAIQELAGHQNLTTTQRYMHLSPAALDSAIRLLDQPAGLQSFGDILETGDREIEKSNS
jgi:integrase